jgi:S-adenosylmethionine hydrolase
MSILSLCTDLGLTDFSVGAAKGLIAKLVPQAKVIDISHNVMPFNLNEAAYFIRNSYPNFPEKSIHIIDVGAGLNTIGTILAIEHNEQFFIAPDNGLLPLIFDTKNIAAVELEGCKPSLNPLMEFMIPAATKLYKSPKLKSIGEEAHKIQEKISLKAVVTSDLIRGFVIYVDVYGNLITNILKEDFDRIKTNRECTISFRRSDVISTISRLYNDVTTGERLSLFGKAGHLEIAINEGKANELLGLKIGDTITCDFS